jgi:hypothetical protein
MRSKLAEPACGAGVTTSTEFSRVARAETLKSKMGVAEARL